MSMIDFEKEFSDFINKGDSSAIKDVYSIIPSLNNSQLKIINTLNYYVSKYDLKELYAFLAEYQSMILKNKNLNLLNSMNVKTLLKAYTQEELIRGIKITNSNVGEL